MNVQQEKNFDRVNLFFKTVATVLIITEARAALVYFNFQAWSTFPVPVCNVPSSMDRTSQGNKVDAVRLYASYRLNLLLLKKQRCVEVEHLNHE